MKWKLTLSLFAILVSLFAALAFPAVARADGPTPPADATFALVACSKMQIIDVVTGERLFDEAIGWQKGLTTKADWEASYVWRVNEFAHLIGCSGDVLTGDFPGKLTFSAGNAVPTFRTILFTNKFGLLGD